jgi:hypothetical protein
MLLKVVQSYRINPAQLITHRFKLDKILDAYDTFGAAAKTNALKRSYRSVEEIAGSFLAYSDRRRS